MYRMKAHRLPKGPEERYGSQNLVRLGKHDSAYLGLNILQAPSGQSLTEARLTVHKWRWEDTASKHKSPVRLLAALWATNRALLRINAYLQQQYIEHGPTPSVKPPALARPVKPGRSRLCPSNHDNGPCPHLKIMCIPLTPSNKHWPEAVVCQKTVTDQSDAHPQRPVRCTAAPCTPRRGAPSAPAPAPSAGRCPSPRACPARARLRCRGGPSPGALRP
jgi:hypothetical protein